MLAKTKYLSPFLTSEATAPHTLSIVDANLLPNNSSVFRFWGYYGVQMCGSIGIAWSNDLVNWTKDPTPVITTGSTRVTTSAQRVSGREGSCAGASSVRSRGRM